jgi:hypothetical protein
LKFETCYYYYPDKIWKIIQKCYLILFSFFLVNISPSHVNWSLRNETNKYFIFKI